MCTLTIITRNAVPAGNGWLVRLVANRDEARTRPAALPPEARMFGQQRAAMPVDPVGGGTWIAANEAGLMGALLNVTQSSDDVRAPPANRPSRGGVIPLLLVASTIDDVLSRAGQLVLNDYAPFRVVIASSRELAELRWDGSRLDLFTREPLDGPRMFTSSGLGDELVYRPRRALFEEMFAGPTDLAAQQDAFQRHVWPGREHVSVQMSRDDARTVSRTVVELSRDSVSLAYRDLVHGTPAVRISLPLVKAN